MKKIFSLKASQISLALDRSWHKIFFFSLISYAAAYIFLHFEAAAYYTPTLVTTLIDAIQAFIL